VETNLVLFDLAPTLRCDAAAFCKALHERGVWMLPTAARRVRAVTNLEVDTSMIDRATAIMADVVRSHS
jgi:threonine aldolase